jgi:hypothetical protein
MSANEGVHVKYIVVDPTSLAVSVSYRRSLRRVSIPVFPYAPKYVLPDLHDILWQFEIEEVDREDRKRGVKIAHRISAPDPALLAIAYIMWQGILQGLTWDVVKGLVRAAFERLRGPGKPPLPPWAKRYRTEFGISWEEHIVKRSSRRLFIGLRREYEAMTPERRLEVAHPRESGYRKAEAHAAKARRGWAHPLRVPGAQRRR